MTTLPSIKWKQEATTATVNDMVDSTAYYKQQAKVNVAILEYRMKKAVGE